MTSYEGPISRRPSEWQPAHSIRCSAAPRSTSPGVLDDGRQTSSRPPFCSGSLARAPSPRELRVPTAINRVPRSSTPAVNRYSQRGGLCSLTFATNEMCAVSVSEVAHNLRSLRWCDVRSIGIDHFLYDSLPDRAGERRLRRDIAGRVTHDTGSDKGVAARSGRRECLIVRQRYAVDRRRWMGYRRWLMGQCHVHLPRTLPH